MIALISSLLGTVSALLPSLVRIFEKTQEYKYETRILELKIDAATKGLEFTAAVEDIKSIVAEGDSVRRHDSLLDSSQFMDNIRASVRPVITYLLFAFFLVAKVMILLVMLSAGTNIPDITKTIFDDHFVALFATVIGFWFGSRSIGKFEEIMANRGSASIQGTFKKTK